jgi:hypothetical protein
MMMARTELHRRKISQQGSDAVSDTEQKEALREAQRKLHKAEEQVAIVKKLIPIFHHAMAEYISHSTPLADHLSGGVDKSLGSLEKMIVALESYLATAPPTTPRGDEGGSGSAAAMTSARAGGSPGESRGEGEQPPDGAGQAETAGSALAGSNEDVGPSSNLAASKPQVEHDS